MIVLEGEKGRYRFNRNNPASVLKSKGKFGSVYLGKDDDGKAVVIKQLSPALASDSSAVNRFLKEAEITTHHPALVACVESISTKSDHFIVREYAPGRSLKETRPDFELSKIVMSDVLDGLQYLHSRNIIHGDIRPHNIIVHENRARIIDLGLAITKESVGDRSPFSLVYSPPEQVLQITEAVTTSSDLYSWAITYYEWLSGTAPFHHEHPEMLMHMMINVPIKPRRKIPGDLFRVLEKATSRHKFRLPPSRYSRQELKEFLLKAQEERFKDALELKSALQQCKPEQSSWLSLFRKK